MPRPDSELLNYSKEHLAYEAAMFFKLGWILERLADVPPIDEVRVTVKNALIESFVMHFRCLGSFLCLPNAKYPDDVLAKEFFNNPSQWSPSIPVELSKALKRADKEIAHLTDKRIAGTNPVKEWQPKERMDEIKPMLKDFVSRSSPSKLHHSVKEFVDALDSWLLIREENTRLEISIRTIVV